MKDIGNVWCPWEVGHVKTRHAGSIPVTSVKVLHHKWVGRQFVRRMLCGQAKSLGRLMEAYIGINWHGIRPLVSDICGKPGSTPATNQD